MTRAKAGPSNGKVETMEGPTVIASEAVVLATLMPINRNLTVQTRQACQRSYVVALEVSCVCTAHVALVSGLRVRLQRE